MKDHATLQVYLATILATTPNLMRKIRHSGSFMGIRPFVTLETPATASIVAAIVSHTLPLVKLGGQNDLQNGRILAQLRANHTIVQTARLVI